MRLQSIVFSAVVFVSAMTVGVPASHAEAATAWDLVYKARVAAQADEHRQAINLFLQAAEDKPLVLGEVAIELANQYTWAEMPDSAIWWYQYVLLGDSTDLDAKLGIARALAWGDKLAESEAYYESLLPIAGDREDDVLIGLGKVQSWQQHYNSAEQTYRQVLADDPENLEAQLGIAEVTLWSGRPRDAQALYRAILADHPGNIEAIKGLAKAQNAAGSPNLALETLGAAQAADDLSRSIDSKGSLNSSNTLLYRDNTTDGDYTALLVGLDVAAANLTEVGVAYTRGRMRQEGRPDITRNEIVVPLRHRFSDLLAVSVNPGYQWNAFDPVVVPPSTDPTDAFNLFVWDAYGTWLPSDWLRMDLGNSRQTLTIPETVFRKIYLTTTNASLDWRLSQAVVSHWVPSFRTYSDGNNRTAFAQNVEWTPPIHVPWKYRNYIVLSENFEYFHFKEQLNNGYFNPSYDTQILGGARWVTDIGKSLNLNIAGAYGGEKQSGVGWQTTGAFEATLQIKLTDNTYIRTGYVYSGSRLLAADGFRAKGAFITLDVYVPR